MTEFILPYLHEQGIEQTEISVWNDSERHGNLKSFIESCEYYGAILGNGGAWHLQDDVVPCIRFNELTTSLSDGCAYDEGIICGYVNKIDEKQAARYVAFNKDVELTSGSYIPFSFPCIYIPNKLLKGFKGFIDKKVFEEGKYVALYERNRYDDLLFAKHILSSAKSTPLKMRVQNPALVEHIGHMLGGSVVTPERKQYRQYMALNFADIEAMEKYRQFISGRGRNGKAEERY